MKKIPKNEAKIDQKTQFLAFYRVSAIGRTGRIFGRIFGIGRTLYYFFMKSLNNQNLSNIF